MKKNFLRKTVLAACAVSFLGTSAYADGLLGDAMNTVDQTTHNTLDTAKKTTSNTWQDAKQTTHKAVGSSKRHAKQAGQHLHQAKKKAPAAAQPAAQ